ncbi:DUF3137 domain-containing protein [Lysinibacter cavernae]|uniref:DUF3137 domain-containing protein n=1 Tax=Lysinibacter cavernae TaxID=1640652 RepID=A0A7X5TRX9_9MICO|nr:DUF3137 domain-containing protein [Lysinibacter cavernae]NIH52195.1 hypothetical protein [Lysinibacter cavernae]
MAKTSPNVPTDFTALQTQPTRAEIREFKLQHPELKPNSVFFTRGTKLFLAVGIAAIVLVPKVIDPRSHSAERLWVTTLLIILVLGVACWIFVSGRITASIVQYQLVRFAADNKLVYTSTGYRPDLPGMIFGLGSLGSTSHGLHSNDKRQLHLETFTTTFIYDWVRYNKSWMYLTFRLDRNLPHIVLDSTRNSAGLFGAGRNKLPVSYAHTQRLSLEGDFDQHFALYCPKEYEADALYILTPDVMSVLIDHAANCDVEILDDRLYVYTKGKTGRALIDAYVGLCAVYAAIAPKTVNQTHRYLDDRMPRPTPSAIKRSRSRGRSAPNQIASQGRRLSRSPLRAIILLGIVIVFLVLPWIAFFSL